MAKIKSYPKQAITYGYYGAYKAVEDGMWRIFIDHWPEWITETEEILYNPTCGIRFCQMVRRQVCENFPDWFILRAFVHIRKSGRLKKKQEQTLKERKK